MDVASWYQRETWKFDNHSPRQRVAALVLGLNAEAGEVANEYERSARVGSPGLNTEKVKEELGDVLWNVARLAAENGWTLGEIMRDNIAKLTRRFDE